MVYSYVVIPRAELLNEQLVIRRGFFAYGMRGKRGNEDMEEREEKKMRSQREDEVIKPLRLDMELLGLEVMCTRIVSDSCDASDDEVPVLSG